MTDIILEEYQRAPDAASSPTPACTAGIVPGEQRQLFNLAPQPFTEQEVPDAGREPNGRAGEPTHDVHSDRESAGSAVSGQEMLEEEQGPNIALLIVLLVGVLSLIVTPGVVLGVLMKQVMMGIALSGAITTVIGTFAGFYYFHSKKG